MDDADFASDTSSQYPGGDAVKQEDDVFAWTQKFTDAERAELLDLAGVYGDHLLLFGNTRARERAERYNKLIVQKKLDWWQQQERNIHDALGIDRAKRRRIKLIMAKLEHRLSKSDRRAMLKKQQSEQELKVTKKVSFTRNTKVPAAQLIS